MKNLLKNAVLIFVISLGLISCRNTEAGDQDQSEVTRMMNDPQNKVEVKDNGEKIKIETPEGDEIKIKKEGDEYKKKVDRKNGEESKLKIDGDEVKFKTDN